MERKHALKVFEYVDGGFHSVMTAAGLRFEYDRHKINTPKVGKFFVFDYHDRVPLVEWACRNLYSKKKYVIQYVTCREIDFVHYALSSIMLEACDSKSELITDFWNEKLKPKGNFLNYIPVKSAVAPDVQFDQTQKEFWCFTFSTTDVQQRRNYLFGLAEDECFFTRKGE